MAYADYLRQRSSECIRLAVEQVWSDETGALIDLALGYSSMASSFDGLNTMDGNSADFPSRADAGLPRWTSH